MHSVARAAIGLVLLTMTAVAPAAQSNRPSYRSLLEMCRTGDLATAVAAVIWMAPGEIELAVKDVIRVERTAFLLAPEQQRIEHRVWLEAAVLLHTEALIAIDDNRMLGLRTAHAAALSRLVEALEAASAPPRRPEELTGENAFLRPWYLLMIAYPQGRGQLGLAMSYVPDARKRIGEDPELLLAIGAIHETAWRLDHEEDRHAGLSGDLKEAEAAYRGALERDPRLEEATVRLGRVLTFRGDLDGALRTFSELRPGVTEPAFLYLARLFEGDVHERRAAFARAAQAYDAAIAAMPVSQSARIALAHLRHVEGNRADAAARVAQAAGDATPTDSVVDPWLWYLKGVAWRVSLYLDALRAIVRR